MTKNGVTLNDIYAAVNRLEDKVDKRICLAEGRLDKLEDNQSKLMGGLAVVSLFVGGAITWIWEKITK